jgi:hypothetical protein
MNAQEQITGVLNLIDHARSVTVSGKPVVIKRDTFEQYPDYEAVLEKLTDEYSAIIIVQYPTMDDVDYHANIGFYPEADLNAAISYQIDVLPKFDELVAQRKGVSLTETLKGTVLLSGNKVLLSLSDGTQKEIKNFRTDMAPHNIMKHLISRPNEPITSTEIYPLMNTKKPIERIDLTEVAREMGFDDTLKDYFFPRTTNKKLYFVPEADIPVAVVRNLK